MEKYALAIHGGAGTIVKNLITPQKEAEYKQALTEAILIGNEILKQRGTALDAIEATVRHLENDALFNAGRGAVFTGDGKIELDASIMCGKTLGAGAVSAVRNVKNPVTLARTIMERTDFVFLNGAGAFEFAQHMMLDIEPDEYFFTQHRYEQLQMIRDTSQVMLDHHSKEFLNELKKFGTVGAVAMDMHGNLAAATSTGGMTNKKFGRIGDSPIVGAGTYANNNTCAVSCTGHGEFFMRAVVGYDVSCLMEYKEFTLKEACKYVVHEKLVKLGGEGGLIAVDKYGNVELAFNSEGMYRGSIVKGGEPQVMIYRDE